MVATARLAIARMMTEAIAIRRLRRELLNMLKLMLL